MAKQTINIGSGELQGDGESIRSAFDKINQNFDELYNNLGSDGSSSDRLTASGDEVILTGGANPYTTFPAITGGDQLLIQGAEIASISGNLAVTSRRGLNVISNTEGLGQGGSFGWIFNAQGDIELPIKFPVQFTAVFDEAHYNGGGTFQGDGTISLGVQLQGLGAQFQWLVNDPTFDTDRGYVGQQAFRYTEADHGITGVNVDILVEVMGPDLETGLYSLQIAFSPAPGPADLAKIRSTDELILSSGTKGWIFDVNGDIYLPAAGDIRNSLGESVLGGAAGPVQPYLEVTNTPFITQPAVLGEPVTVTAAPAGINANFMVTITEGPTLDVGSIIVSNGGSGYTVGQRYRLWYYNIGGPDLASSIDFEVETVGEDGAILTIINAAFVGSASNVPGTYEFVSAELRASVFDEIDTGLTLTRDGVQGIYNIELESEYDNNTHLSPLGTEWNADGWGNLLELGTRSYTTWRQALNNAVGNNIVPAELVMHDIANDRYYKFDFTVWGGNNGGYSYTRTEVTDPNYFRKPHNAELADIIVADDPEGTGIAIARTDGAGIFNLYQEQSFAAESPVGTTWNADGWDDLSNIETRTYSVFDLAANGYNNVLGKKFVMYVASTQKYYAIEFLEWDTTGNNNFAYVRKEIDLTKVNEGVRFADGTLLKSAEGIGRVKLTSPNNRRIEEVHGYNQVSVTGKISTDYTGLSARTTDTNYEIFVQRTPELDTVLQPIWDNGGAEISISFDNVTFTPSFLSSIQTEEYWFYYNNYNSFIPQTEGNNVYIRITTGGDPAVWWNKADLPGGSADFRGAVIDYHAWTGESTIVGSIHIVDDSGEEHISHQEVASGSTDGENDDLWLVQNEGTISYRRIDGEQKTLKVQWTAKVFYGSEFWD